MSIKLYSRENHTNKLMFLILFLVSVGLVVFIYAYNVGAESNNDSTIDNTKVTLSPVNRTIDIKPGKTYKNSFTVYNNGQTPINFNVFARPYSIKNDNYNKPLFDNETTRTQMYRWISFSQRVYTLAPGSHVEIPYKIVVPDSIPAGGQYAALFAKVDYQSIADNPIKSKSRIGMLLYAHSNGHTINKGSSSAPDLNFFYSSPTFDVNQKVTNEGNTDFSAKTSLTVHDIFGNKKFSTTKSKKILPETSRVISLKWDNPPPLSLLKVKTKVKILDKTKEYQKTILYTTPTSLFFIIVVFVAIIITIFYVPRRHRAKNN